ncbi:S-methyl-5-thioribose kinase [Salinibacterium sp. M195]|uniref:S-methyl-5-thioribose kinase n=1 Tax=Salinibacterium sp. M195 TaxID=2583374 RepID=UPI001C629645|nr:S-methyl-5-thioribose kinase [Salinibacterium sp. M195]QYH36013.1 S-methyl-5-thioribose kinase [Salinibacterium sp. M195]
MTTDMLNLTTVSDYIRSRPALQGLIDPENLDVAEVGDGNLNLVFVCRDSAGRGLVLKQSLPYVRLVGPEWPMTEDRAAREATALSVHGSLAPELVCRLIDYDNERHVLALEDLTDHEVLRSRLNNGSSHRGAFAPMGRLIARVLAGTSWMSLGEEAFRLQAGATINSELCRISEDLVFTEPFLGGSRNSVRASVEDRADALQSDTELVASAMRMKRRFLSVQEALVHGDLHTGSMFVRGQDADDNLSVKAFDSEFAFYGPIGFDLGLLWGNILAAAARAAALGEEDRAASLFSEIEITWDAFDAEIRTLWASRVNPELYADSFLESWLKDILDDAWGFAGAEAARRVVGLAKVSDVESLADADYVYAVTIMLSMGRSWLVERSTRDFDSYQREFLAAATARTV